MQTGIQGRSSFRVTEDLLACALGSGLVRVYATPAMIAAMENTAAGSVQGALNEGETTVGSNICVSHVSATPLGMMVTIETELLEVSANGRVLTFSVRASDECGLIGEGTHVRVIVNRERFEGKAQSKGR